MHTPAVVHDMHKDHPLTLWVEEHLRRMHLNRWRLVAYQQLPIGLRIPLRMHHCLHLPWKPFFAMQALFALTVSQKIAVRNRAYRCVPFSETRVYYTCFLSPPETSDPTCSIMRYFASDYEKHVMSLNTKFRYARCSDTHRQV